MTAALFKFAAIADIHGNAHALEAVLTDIDRQGITEIVNLGDHFSGPLEAGATADLLISRNMVSIRGNHDRNLVEQPPQEMGPSDQVAHAQLQPAHLNWLKQLPPTTVFRDEVFLCHGTPTSDTDYWLEAVDRDGKIAMAALADIEAAADGIGYPLILCGHSHIPRTVQLQNGRMIVNPGSVGCPGYDDDKPVYHIMETGTPLASYAILEKSEHHWSVGFRQIPYDNMSMAALAQERGRPEWASALATGWIRTT